jgi:hypothetical protein
MSGDKRVKCNAMTREGRQCSRNGTTTHTNGRLFCTQHYSMSKGTIATAAAAPEPWVCLRLSSPVAQNGPHALQKLRTVLRRGPRKNDNVCSGFIYVYYLTRDTGENYWKIGMTTRDDCSKRLAEWKRTYAKEAGFKVMRTYPTRAPQFAERLIHLYLYYCRMYRYPLERGKHGHHSVWAKDNTVIADGQQLQQQPPSQGRAVMVARRKNTEWFCVPLKTVHSTVREIITMIDAWDRRKRALLL